MKMNYFIHLYLNHVETSYFYLFCFSYGMMTPINFLEGIHLDFSNMVEITPFKSEDDFNKYISRLTAVKERVIGIFSS